MIKLPGIHSRHATPLLGLLLCLVLVVPAVGQNRVGSPEMLRTALVLLLTVAGLSLSARLGNEGLLPPWLAAWAPEMVLGGFAARAARRWSG